MASKDARADLRVGRVEPLGRRRPVVDPPQRLPGREGEERVRVGQHRQQRGDGVRSADPPQRDDRLEPDRRARGPSSSAIRALVGDRHGALAQGAGGLGADVGDRRLQGVDQRDSSPRACRRRSRRAPRPGAAWRPGRSSGSPGRRRPAPSAGLAACGSGPSGPAAARCTTGWSSCLIWASIGSESLPRGRVLTASAPS